jgi:polyphosphate kinase 2 (PPK2 family)
VKGIRIQSDGKKTHEFTKEEKKWKEYSDAYTDVIIRCGTKNIPWYVIPSNKKWFRRWVIAKIIFDTLEDL